MDSRSQTKKISTLLMLISLIAMVALLFAGCEQPTPKPVPQETPPEPVVVVVDDPAPDADNVAPQEPETPTEEEVPEPAPLPSVKKFVLTGENFKFRMDGKAAPELKVNVGDTVRIEFRSTDGLHDWTVDEFNAATRTVQTGGSTFVEFVADKAGTFQYYCSVGNHRQLGMIGNLVVG